MAKRNLTRIYVYPGTTLKSNLQREARKQGRSVSNLVAKILNDHFEPTRKRRNGHAEVAETASRG